VRVTNTSSASTEVEIRFQCLKYLNILGGKQVEDKECGTYFNLFIVWNTPQALIKLGRYKIFREKQRLGY